MASSETSIRIGVNPIGWSNDDLQEVGGDTPLETCLAEAREAGFAGMELGHKFPREATALKAALAPSGMACVGGWHSVELLRRDARSEFDLARGHRDLLKAMGTDVFIVAETSNAIHGDRAIPLSRRPRLAASEWAPFCRRMKAAPKTGKVRMYAANVPGCRPRAARAYGGPFDLISAYSPTGWPNTNPAASHWAFSSGRSVVPRIGSRPPSLARRRWPSAS
jgi:sugar phosphate isomerase/epimerase